MDGARIIALDVDIIIAFTDGGKLLLPNLGLLATGPNPPSVRFAGRSVTWEQVFSSVTDVAIGEPTATLSNIGNVAKAGKPQEETQSKIETPENQDVPQPIQPAPLVRAKASPPQDVLPAGEPPVVRSIPLEAPKPIVLNTGSVTRNDLPVVIEPITPGVPPLKIAVTLDLLNSPVATPAQNNSDGSRNIFYAAGAPGSDTDASYAIQSAPRTAVAATNNNDTLFLDDPQIVPAGYAYRKLAISVEGLTSGLDITKVTLSGFPAGVTLVGIQIVQGVAIIPADTLSGGFAEVGLLYKLPDATSTVDESGFYNSFDLSVTASAVNARGINLSAIETLRFGVRDVFTQADTIYDDGVSAVNVLWANPPGAVADAGGGNDTIYASAGADTITGGSGSDLLSYANSNSAVSVNLARGGVGVGGSAQGDLVLDDIERVNGSSFADSLLGSSGDNVFKTGGGADTINGAGGSDTVDFSESTAGVTVNLTSSASQSGGDAQGVVLTNIENIIGSATGANALVGDSHDNYLEGGALNDTFIGGGGHDTFVGGAGFNVLDLSSSQTAVSIDVQGADVVLTNISKIIGAANYANTLVGGDSSEIFVGGSGDDSFIGRGGDDTILGGGGADTFRDDAGQDSYVGGSGNDVLIASANFSGVQYDAGAGFDTVNLSSYTSASTLVVALFDDASGRIDWPGSGLTGNFLNVEAVIGAAGLVNRLTGDSSSNFLMGGNLADTISGGDGADTIVGGLGNDVLDGGGNAGDTIDYSTASAALSVTVSGSAYTARIGAGETDTLSGFTNFIGSDFGDRIYADSQSGFLSGGAGNDTLSPGLGADTVDGGVGQDIVDLSYLGLRPISLALSSTATLSTGNDQFVRLTNIEGVIGGGGDDTLQADAAHAGYLSGGAGNDLLVATSASGGATFEGGDGVDTLDYSASTVQISVDLSTNASGVLNMGANADLVRNIENFIGGSANDTITAVNDSIAHDIFAGSGNDSIIGGNERDTLSGSLGDDTIDGGGGADVIRGGSGNDSLFGGAGADTILGDGGADTIDGGEGADSIVGDAQDILSYRNTTGVSIDLRTGNALAGGATDTFSGIAQVVGSSSGDNTFFGDDNSNTLMGGGGNDYFQGRLGGDSFVGGGGTDTLDLNDRTVGVSASLGGSGSIALSANETDYYTGISRFQLTEGGDTVTAWGVESISYLGEGGNDSFVAMAGGSDTLDGGDGAADRISFAGGDFLGVTATLSNGALRAVTASLAVGGSQVDSIANFEIVTGSSGNDSFVAEAGTNYTFVGTGGNDTFSSVGNAAVFLDYENYAGVSSISVDLQSATQSAVLYGANNVVLKTDRFLNVHGVRGPQSAASGTFIGDASGNELIGGAGNDYMLGGSGDDTLKGGLGNDTLFGSSRGQSADAGDILDYSYTNDEASSVLGLTYNMNGDSTGAFVTVGAGDVDFVGRFRNIIATSGNDSIVTDANANTVDLGSGDDTIVGISVSDSFVGGAGHDLLDLSAQAGNISVTLNGDQASTLFVNGANSGMFRQFEDVVAGSGDDTIVGDASSNKIVGNDGADSIIGGSGHDTLSGGVGNDTIIGGIGDDSISGGLGNNRLDGGDGADALYYGDASVGISVSLAAGIEATVSIGIERDTIMNFEIVTGSAFADSIVGGSSNETFMGGGDDDTLVGGGGSNFLSGGQGNDWIFVDASAGSDTVDGGDGVDTLDFSRFTQGVSVSLRIDGSYVAVIGDRTVTLINFENLVGGDGNDTLVGNALPNVIDGGKGDDSLYGAEDNDTLIGGVGADTLRGGLGVDSLKPGRNPGDFINNEDKVDGISQHIDGFETPNYTGSEKGDTLIGDPGYAYQLIGLGGDDSLIGNSLDDVLSGGLGNDTLLGFAGNDTIDGGAGNDSLDGGDGTGDVLSYSGASLGISVVVPNANGAVTVHVGASETDIVVNFENVIGGSGNDTISFAGSTADHYLAGNAGDDCLVGGSGSDIIFAGRGADTILGGLGNDLLAALDSGQLIDGQGGVDTVDFSGIREGVSIALDANRSDLTAYLVRGGTIHVSGIENVFGTEADDTLTGNDLSNLIAASGGNDSIAGGNGADTIFGGAGDDIVDAGLGSDSIDGGIGGGDTISYFGRSDGISIALQAGAISTISVTAGETDLIVNFENVVGGLGADTISSSDSLSHAFFGGAGDDSLVGGTGDDSLDGGDGVDTLSYAARAENVNVTFTSATAALVSIGASENDTIVNIENILGGAGDDTLSAAGDAAAHAFTGGGGNDLLIGGLGADTLLGGAGADTIVGSSGADVLDGGDGVDVIDYSSLSASQSVSLTFGSDSTVTVVVSGDGVTSVQRLVNFEGFIGSGQSDTLTGGADANTLNGGAGDDSILGNSAADSLFGGLGADTLRGGLGADTFDGGDGRDYVSFADQTAGVSLVLNAGSGTASLGGGVQELLVNVENLIGGSGNDTLAALTTDAGTHVFLGGGGDDSLVAGTGADTFDGGSGLDTLSYADRTSGISVELQTATVATVSVSASESDLIVNIEKVIGGSGADTISAASDTGAHTFIGGAGADSFVGGFGSDVIDGGDDFDTLSYAGRSVGFSGSIGSNGVGTISLSANETDQITNIEALILGAGADTLSAADSSAHTFFGGAGDDSLVGGTGDDSLDGGDGVDTLSYAARAENVNVSFTSATAALVSIGSGEKDTIVNIENILGGAGADVIDYSGLSASQSVSLTFGSDSTVTAVVSGGGVTSVQRLVNFESFIGSGQSDTLTGGADANTLNGGAGDDSILGNSAADSLFGGLGADTLRGGLGADTFDGGDGRDYVSFADQTAGVSLVLNAGSGTASLANGEEDLLVNIENLIGGSGNDTLAALTTDAGSHAFLGGGGDDSLVAGTGADTFDGGSGLDTLSYADRTSGISVELQTATVATVSVSVSENDLIVNIEKVTGGSGDDTLSASSDTGAHTFIGGAGADSLVGGSAADALFGGAGNDVLEGGFGNDTLDGGDGLDTVSYAARTLGLSISIDSTGAGAINLGLGETDQIANIENITGGSGADTLSAADGSAHSFSGGAGNNYLTGGSGADTLLGGADQDTLIGGLGNDSLDGGDGLSDLVSYATETADLKLVFQSGTAATVSLALDNIDQIVNIENVTTGSGADTISAAGDTVAHMISAGAGADLLIGGSGADTLLGGAGTDTIIASLGADRLDGGDDVDTISYAGLSGGQSVSMFLGSGATVTAYVLENGAVVGSQILVNFENVIGSAANDTLTGFNTAGTFDGGDGQDYVSFADQTAGVSLVLNAGSGTASLGGGVQDLLVNVENLIGGSGNDTLAALTTDAGPHAFLGGGGDDSLVAGTGSDTFDGGSGLDTLSYADRTSGISVELQTATVATVSVSASENDLIVNIEKVIGGSGDDTISAANDTGAHTFIGGAGADSFVGGFGSDVIDGGDDFDTLSYAGRSVGLSGSIGSNGVGTISLSASETDQITNIETIILGAGADTLSAADSSAHTFFGGAGDDFLVGGTGDDSLDGGDGVDTLSYAARADNVNVTFTSATAALVSIGSGENDTIVNIENILGGAGADTLSAAGDAAAHAFTGGGGNDLLVGGLGADTLLGGAGADTIVFSSGADVLDGGDGVDVIDYSSLSASQSVSLTFGSDSTVTAVVSGGGVTSVQRLVNFEGFIGSGQSDTLTGGADANTLNSGAGDDSILGNSAADSLFGGLGADTLRGGPGADTFDGGDGQDYVSFTDQTAGVRLVLNAGAGTASLGGGVQQQVVNVENLIGGSGNDTLGSLANDTTSHVFLGSGGNDSLFAGTGADTLDGGDGNDTIVGNGGADSYLGGLGDDSLVGGASNDTFFGNAGADTIVGGGGADVVYGGAGADFVSGGTGSDTISGDDGNDTVLATGGSDVLDGGVGNDLVDYSAISTGITVVMSGSSYSVTIAGAVQTVTNFEYLIGSGSDDSLQGSSGNETFDGNVGNDTLGGGAGADSLFGGAGNDLILGGVGADTFDGGSGIDTVDYSYLGVTSGISVSVGASGWSTVYLPDGEIDLLQNIENILGGSGADTLIGSSSVTLNGGGGADSIWATGAASLFGGAGNDTIYSGTGNDTVDGGADIDLITYANRTSAVIGTLNGANLTSLVIGAEVDNVANVENLILGSGSDSLFGLDNVNHVILGGGGADTISTQGGNDTLDGGTGADSLSGGAGNDFYVIDSNSDAITDSSGVDTIQTSSLQSVNLNSYTSGGVPTIENLTYTGTGDFTGSGNWANNVLTGSTGADSFFGASGADTIDGGLGADTLNGGRGADSIIGGGGNDSLVGGGGADTLSGGQGDDTIVATSDNYFNVTNAAQNALTASFAPSVYVANSTAGIDTQKTVNGASLNQFTLAFAMRDSFDPGGSKYVGLTLSTPDGLSTYQLLVGLTPGQPNPSVTITSNNSISVSYASSSVTFDGEFHTYAVSVSSDNTSTFVSLYRDGVQLSTGEVINGIGGHVATGRYIQQLQVSPRSATNTAFDDVSLWTGQLSESDLATVSSGYSVGNTSAGTLVANYTFDGANALANTVSGGIDLVAANAALISTGGSSLSGGDGADNLLGGSASDTLSGGLGNDTIDGGAGADVVDYTYLSGANAPNLNITIGTVPMTLTLGNGDTDVLRDIMGVLGASGADTLVGDSTDNFFSGGFGNDSIVGGAGNDTIDYSYITDPSKGVSLDLTSSVAVLTVSVGAGDIDTIVGFENALGGAGDDTILGGSGANFISGGDGADSLSGGSGNDTLVGGAGNDRIDGGSGVDVLDYSARNVGITGQLNGATFSRFSVGSGEVDLVANIENVIGGSGDDSLVGDSNANFLTGGLGNDTLRGGLGNDTLVGGGQSGDLIDYSNSAGGINYSLSGGGLQTVTIGSTGQVGQAIGFRNLIGTSFADSVVGDVTANLLLLGAGDDTIQASTGADTLDGGDGVDTFIFSTNTFNGSTTPETLVLGGSFTIGLDIGTIVNFENVIGMNSSSDLIIGDGHDNNLSGRGGNDTLLGGDGSDTISGGTGADSLDGGAGNDFIDYSYSANGISIDLASSSMTLLGEVDRYINFEGVIGGSGSDWISGDSGANTLYGLDGSDTLTGGAGNDVLDGGAGNDVVNYSYTSVSLTVDLSQGPSFTLSVAAGDVDTLINVEGVIGGTGNDSLLGNSGANFLSGGNGSDTLLGKDGSDTLSGGAGNDLLDGGDGNDVVNYSYNTNSTLGISVDLSQGSTLTVSVAAGDVDTLINFEGVIGGAGNDSLSGSSGANYLAGGNGADTLLGNDGSDTLSGGAGNDILDGGAGADVVDYSYNTSSATGVSVDLSQGSTLTLSFAAGDVDTLINFEGVIGGAGNDTLIGDNAANFLSGGAGADTLLGNDGSDTLSGGAGNDVLDGGAGNDFVDFTYLGTTGVSVDLSKGSVIVTPGETDTLINFEGVIGGAGNDYLAGNSAANTLFGSDGMDTLSGGAGNDWLDGGVGTDIVDYTYTSVGLALDLSQGPSLTVSVAAGDVDTLINIEGVIGGSGSDSLLGSSGANYLYGGAGADTLLGNDGSDTLSGGAGNDVLDGGAGNDVVDYSYITSGTQGISVDLSRGTPFTLTLSGGETDTLTNFEGVIGGAGSDYLSGNAGANFLSGGLGSDTLSGGGGGADTLFGNEGNDLLIFNRVSFVSMVIDGGSGIDTVQFQQNGAFTGADLAAAITNVEVLDFKPTGANVSLSLSGADIAKITGATSGSQHDLNILTNAGDSVTVSDAADHVVMTSSGNTIDYAIYDKAVSDNSKNLLAHLIVTSV